MIIIIIIIVVVVIIIIIIIISSSSSSSSGAMGAIVAPPTGVCGKTPLSGEPLPWSLTAETPLRPLIWYFSG